MVFKTLGVVLKYNPYITDVTIYNDKYSLFDKRTICGNKLMRTYYRAGDKTNNINNLSMYNYCINDTYYCTIFDEYL